MKYCKTCKYKNEYEECDNPKLTDSPPVVPEDSAVVADMLVYSYDEGGAFYVGDKFGCVHHAEKEGKDGI